MMALIVTAAALKMRATGAAAGSEDGWKNDATTVTGRFGQCFRSVDSAVHSTSQDLFADAFILDR